MSKAAKSIVSVALPIVGSIVAPGIGTALGSALSSATLAGIGGAVGGAAGGAISGGGVKGALKGAVTGGAGGYLAGGGLSNVIGTAARTLPAGVSGPVTSGSGILGALGNTGTAIADGVGSITSRLGSTTALSSNPLLSLGSIGSSLYSASSGAAAAEKAAQQQAQAYQNGITAQQNALMQIRGDLQPYREAGTSTVGGLTQLVNDPNAQAQFIQNNPFYQSLADDAKNKLFANAAAKGKLGSGGTADALQNSLLLLGNNLLNQSITQRQNLANTGSNAAAQTGTFTQGAADTNSNALANIGLSNAAGTIGGYNAKTGAINNALGSLTSLYAIDKGVSI